MIVPILDRQLVAFARNRRFHLVAVVLVALCGVASLDGWLRARDAAEARRLAELSDRTDWLEQGKNSPHGAAHFARYAFRPTPSLAAFDPGTQDYAGSAVWLEAHYQDPATLRRAEVSSSHAPVAALSPGWIICIVGTLTLLVLLSPTVAGERELGTMRAVSAAGATGREFVTAKAIAALLAVSAVTIVALLVSLAPAFVVGVDQIEGARVAALIGSYLIGLGGFGLVVVALSARVRSASAALVNGAAFWLYAAVLVPAVAAQVASTLHPDVDEQAFKSALQLEAQTPFWKGDAREPAIAAYEAKVLEAYGAPDLESLGFNREAVELQAHEEFANAAFDRLYGELRQTHHGQDEVLRWASLASPVLALRRLSAGISGTDLGAQDAFVVQAERHRRQIVAALNKDMMEHAGDKGFAYTAGRELWEQTPDFDGRQPSLAAAIARHRVELLSLLAWLVLGGWVAVRWMTRAMRQESGS